MLSIVPCKRHLSDASVNIIDQMLPCNDHILNIPCNRHLSNASLRMSHSEYLLQKSHSKYALQKSHLCCFLVDVIFQTLLYNYHLLISSANLNLTL